MADFCAYAPLAGCGSRSESVLRWIDKAEEMAARPRRLLEVKRIDISKFSLLHTDEEDLIPKRVSLLIEANLSA